MRILVFLLLLVSNAAFGSALVAGVFKNALYGRRVEVQVNHRYVDGKISTFQATVDSSGAFVLEVQVPEPQLVTLIYDDDKLVFFLEPLDTVFIETDALQFPLVVSFGGRGEFNNRLLRQFLQENPTDFNEFNLLRYKSGTMWLAVPAEMDVRMQNLDTTDFKTYVDKRKLLALTLLDEFTAQHTRVSSAFREFLTTEIIFAWAYDLLFYGSIYKNFHHVEPPFFEFLWEVPTTTEAIGSHTYRQFLMAEMNYLRLKNDPDAANQFVSQNQLAADRLTGKSLAFFRSENILNALNANYLNDILPAYNDFLKTNPFHQFDEKISQVFEKEARYAPGTTAQNFEGKDRNGNDVSLAALRGKVVLLDFWASWCSPCLHKMDELAAFLPELEAAGVQIVYVSLDSEEFEWQKTIAERGIRGTHLLSSGKKTVGNIAQSYDVKAIPQFFIIGKDGRFAEKPHSYKLEDLKNRLVQLASQSN